LNDWSLAGEALSAGEVLGFPTETIYGIGCNPKDEKAVADLVALKGREQGKGLPLVAANAEFLEQLDIEEAAKSRELRISLQEQHWPGALTIVLQLKQSAFAIGVSAPDGSIAVRVSPLAELVGLAEACEGFLIATSANLSGKPVAENSESFIEYFPKTKFVDDFSRPSSDALPSTIVDLRSGKIEVLREGSVKVI
jgi:L-threonylcarbamoyladenylate synthase